MEAVMDDEVRERHVRSLNEACAKLGISRAALLESAAGRWYVLRVEQELQEAFPADLSLAISNTIELAAGLPADQRQGVQGIGTAQLLALFETK